MLATRGVKFHYGRKRLFENLDLKILPGLSLGVTGKSGCGKSSLLYLLSGLKRPAAGQVMFGDEDLWASERRRLQIRREHFGFIFQQHFLINYLTVLENVLVPCPQPENSTERARELLAYLEMDGLEDNFPYQLSGGQRQRVAIARALVNRPSVIFADEPTASLDAGNAQATLQLLHEYQQANQAALILVTHSPDLLEGFDQVLHLPLNGGSHG